MDSVKRESRVMIMINAEAECADDIDSNDEEDDADTIETAGNENDGSNDFYGDFHAKPALANSRSRLGFPCSRPTVSDDAGQKASASYDFSVYLLPVPYE